MNAAASLSFLFQDQYLSAMEFGKIMIETEAALAFGETATLEVCVVFPNLHQSSTNVLTIEQGCDFAATLANAVSVSALEALMG